MEDSIEAEDSEEIDSALKQRLNEAEKKHVK